MRLNKQSKGACTGQVFQNEIEWGERSL